MFCAVCRVKNKLHSPISTLTFLWWVAWRN